jgi:hypothetical protein
VRAGEGGVRRPGDEMEGSLSMHAELPEFITDPAGVTPEWLTRALRQAGVLSGGHVVSIGCTKTTKMVVSYCLNLSPKYSADAPPKAPRRLFLKFSRPDLAEQFWESHNQNEVIFYERVAPLMKGMPFMRCYAARYCAETGASYVLLHDVNGTHMQPPQPLPPSRGNCRRAIVALAQLHAAWWEDPRLGKDFGIVERGDTLIPEELRKHVMPFVRFLGDRLTPHRQAIYRRLVTAKGSRWANPAQPRGLTLVHGDAHCWNFFYPRDRVKDRVLIFDWHRWCVDVGPRDAAHMMARSWYRDRREWLEMDMLRLYHDSLLGRGVANYTWDDCWHDYRKSVLRNLIAPVRNWAQGRKPSLWWAVLERAMQAVEDLKCEEFLEGGAAGSS